MSEFQLLLPRMEVGDAETSRLLTTRLETWPEKRSLSTAALHGGQMAAQEALKPWLQLAELTGQPGEVAALLQQQLRAHKAKLAAPTEPEP